MVVWDEETVHSCALPQAKPGQGSLPTLRAGSRIPLHEAVGNPEGPSTRFLSFLVPKTILREAFRTRNLKYWVLGPSRK